ncbi:MAG: hypothetical protein MUE30_19620 [Spirosomaceae bacterium]|jgi:hypothetical protein|nr:hypothetical protein [Spirosomataceae bacterium]
MDGQLTVTDIVKNVTDWGIQDFENLYGKLSALRLQKRGVKVLNKTESKLLTRINLPFPTDKLERLQYLDWKSEFGTLSEVEEDESLKLAELYESYFVERTKALTQLASLRQITLDELTTQLGLKTPVHG